MNITFDEINSQVASLSLSERKALIANLIKSLDELDEDECEKLWMKEASRRYQGYKKGNVGSKLAHEVFSLAKNELKDCS
ncbi:MAG TPA: addiction module protein [Desulfohalobiaceae bacterium]|nr:addiction module protein [Desulfohalobiaceae bacterium]